MWRHVATKSPATQSRWHWTWAIDDFVFRTLKHLLAIEAWQAHPEDAH